MQYAIVPRWVDNRCHRSCIILQMSLAALLEQIVLRDPIGPRTINRGAVSLKELEDKGYRKELNSVARDKLDACKRGINASGSLTWEQAVKMDDHLRSLLGPVEQSLCWLDMASLWLGSKNWQPAGAIKLALHRCWSPSWRACRRRRGRCVLSSPASRKAWSD